MQKNYNPLQVTGNPIQVYNFTFPVSNTKIYSHFVLIRHRRVKQNKNGYIFLLMSSNALIVHYSMSSHYSQRILLIQ